MFDSIVLTYILASACPADFLKEILATLAVMK